MKEYGTNTKKIIDALESIGVKVKDLTLKEFTDSIRTLEIVAFINDEDFRVRNGLPHKREPWHITPLESGVPKTHRITFPDEWGWSSAFTIAYADEEDAKRIVACVNACAGFTNEELKKGVQLKEKSNEQV